MRTMEVRVEFDIVAYDTDIQTVLINVDDDFNPEINDLDYYGEVTNALSVDYPYQLDKITSMIIKEREDY